MIKDRSLGTTMVGHAMTGAVIAGMVALAPLWIPLAVLGWLWYKVTGNDLWA